jgi:hypothetical protein
MADQTKHLAVVSFEVQVSNVILLTTETESAPATYRCSIVHLNSNQQGALSPVLVGYGIEDFAGEVFEVIAVGSGTIDVSDIFRCGQGLVPDRIAIVFKPVVNSPLIAPNRYDQLDKSALDKHRQRELDFLVKKLYAEKYKLPLELNSIAEAVEYGVAVGQGNVIEGNKSFAIGEGHITKSFVETVIGYFAKVGVGQTPDSWIPTDFLATIGNGVDDSNRSNAIEVYKSGLVKLYNSLLIGEYSHGAVDPVNGMIQYTEANGFEKWEDTEWVPFSSNSFPDTITSETINEDNGTTHTHELGDVSIDNVVGGNPVDYGAIYNDHSVKDARYITSSSDWTVLSGTQVQSLSTFLGGNTVSGGKLKEVGLTHWNTPNTGATDEVLLTVRGGGYRADSDGNFYSLKNYINYWLLDEYGGFPRFWQVDKSTATLSIQNTGYSGIRKMGAYVRLVKSSTTLADGQTGIYVGNDSKAYPTICIDGVEYLACNLNETKYRNGDWITGYDDGVYTPISSAAWAALTTEAMCYYDDNEAYGGGQTPLSELLHEPVTIHVDSADSLSIDENQVLSFHPIEDMGFEIRDITAGTAESFTLDIKATFAHTIESIDLETDNGTLTGVSVLINATPVTGMSSITVDTAVDTTLSTAAKTVAIGDRVYLSVTTGYTGTPTLIRGKLTTKRI